MNLKRKKYSSKCNISTKQSRCRFAEREQEKDKKEDTDKTCIMVLITLWFKIFCPSPLNVTFSEMELNYLTGFFTSLHLCSPWKCDNLPRLSIIGMKAHFAEDRKHV